MKILLTTYGPFRDIDDNITRRIGIDLSKKPQPEGVELRVLTMEVDWHGVEAMLEQTMNEYMPNVVLSLGHANTYTALTIEKTYFNIAEGEDIHGVLRDGGIIK